VISDKKMEDYARDCVRLAQIVSGSGWRVESDGEQGPNRGDLLCSKNRRAPPFRR
jgi:hypothetical protein